MDLEDQRWAKGGDEDGFIVGAVVVVASSMVDMLLVNVVVPICR